MNGNEEELHRAFIALGSNIEPERNLPCAVERLRELGQIAAVSNVYGSPPIDGSDQPHYLNAAVLLLTDISPAMLCQEGLPAIENALGRIRDPDDCNAPRTIDLDLVLYDDAVLTIGHRQIPDPDIPNRSFLAVPLAELDGPYRLPNSESTLTEIAEGFELSSDLKLRRDVRLNR